MKKSVDTIEVEFITNSRNIFDVNYDINWNGLKRKFLNPFINYWKLSYNLLCIYSQILSKQEKLDYAKANLYLYKLWLKWEKRFAYGKGK